MCDQLFRQDIVMLLLGQGHVSIGPSTIGRWLFILNFEIERHPICSLRKTDEEMICYCTNGFGHTIM